VVDWFPSIETVSVAAMSRATRSAVFETTISNDVSAES